MLNKFSTINSLDKNKTVDIVKMCAHLLFDTFGVIVFKVRTRKNAFMDLKTVRIY